MVTEEQYQQAVKDKQAAEDVMNVYYAQKDASFKKRIVDGDLFTDDELMYSATSLCPCGHGLAYPKDCGPAHYWDCSAILKGCAKGGDKHTDQLPFMYYEVHAESEHRGTTRGVFKPQKVDKDA